MKKLVVLATVGVMMACVTGCTSPVTSPAARSTGM